MLKLLWPVSTLIIAIVLLIAAGLALLAILPALLLIDIMIKALSAKSRAANHSAANPGAANPVNAVKLAEPKKLAAAAQICGLTTEQKKKEQPKKSVTEFSVHYAG
jgi:hypothetical protein